MQKKIAIIGAGASGLFAAICAARRGFEVVLYEKSTKVGRKILATGNGRCNISNENISLQNYQGCEPSFVKYALNEFNTNEVKKFFSNLGLEMLRGTNGRLFPMSLQASSVVEFLFFASKELGVEIVLGCEVKDIEKLGDKFRVGFNDINREFDKVIISTGSLAMPTLGSSDSGYKFAKKLGHSLEKPFASLVQLVCSDDTIAEASGVKVVADLEIFVDGEFKDSVRGDLLFTNYGLSGSGILDISRSASFGILNKKEVEIKIDLLPDISLEALKSLLLKRVKLSQTLPNELWLNGIVHKKLIKLIFMQGKISQDVKINIKIINKLAYVMKHLSLKIDDTKGVKSCEVMAGGVLTKDINPKTFESKLVPGVYFCGEVLDIDGDCGGYNLHFAWAGGYLAGMSL
jgi:hypothetical protein